jgi:hypothetical protein
MRTKHGADLKSIRDTGTMGDETMSLIEKEAKDLLEVYNQK